MFTSKMYLKLSTLLEPGFLGFLVFASMTLMVIMICFWRNRGFIEQLLLCYFFMCFAVITLDYFKPFLILHNDAVRMYIPAAMDHVNDWRKSIVGSMLSFDVNEFIFGKPAYIYPLSLVFYLFADSLQAARFLSSIFGILLIYEVYQIAKALFGTRTAKLTAILLMASPYYLMLSCSIIRETITVFFIAWFFRLWILYEKAPTKKLKYLMIFSLIFIGTSRPAVFLVMIVVYITYKTVLNVDNKNMFIMRALKLGLLAVGLILICNLLNNDAVLSQIRITQGVKFADTETMSKRFESSADGDSGYAGDVHYDNIFEGMLYLPLLVTYFMGSPFPWMVKKTNQAIALVDSSVLWFIYIFFFLEVKSFWKRNRKWASILFTYLFMGICSAALIQANMAAAVRHRLMFTIIILPFAAHSILKRFVGERDPSVKKLPFQAVTKGSRQAQGFF